MTGLEFLRHIIDELDRSPYLARATSALYDAANSIERDQEKMVKDSPYDAILPEDREAIAWVRDNGGIENIQDELANDRELVRIVRDALWPDGKVPCCENGNEQISDELKKRIMPQGYEWPRFEDGEKVSYGSEYVDKDGKTQYAWHIGFDSNKDVEISRLEISSNGAYSYFSICDFFDKGEKLKRPKKGIVGADGLHINDDETVYIVDGNGEPLYVIDTKEDGYQTVIVRNPSGYVNNYDAQRLTHTKPEPPDSWEQLEKDAVLGVCRYFHSERKPCSECQINSINCAEVKERDIVRRAKALAERERAE